MEKECSLVKSVRAMSGTPNFTAQCLETPATLIDEFSPSNLNFMLICRCECQK